MLTLFLSSKMLSDLGWLSVDVQASLAQLTCEPDKPYAGSQELTFSTVFTLSKFRGLRMISAMLFVICFQKCDFISKGSFVENCYNIWFVRFVFFLRCVLIA